MNHLIMAIPCLMYLASVGTCQSPLKADDDVLINTVDVAEGAAHIFLDPGMAPTNTSINLNTASLSICFSLDVRLTLMIVIRLVVHIRSVRRATGASDGSTGLHTAATTVATMLIESYALYAIALLLYIVPWVLSSPVVDLFAKVLGSIQVCFIFVFS